MEEIPEEFLARPLQKKQPEIGFGQGSFGGFGQSSYGQSGRGQGSFGQPRPGSGKQGFHVYQPPKPTAELPDYRPGDIVRHASFGRGMILTVSKMGNDALLEIAFDEKGTKRLMAKTASSHMKKE